jgi:hypothetical protein
VRLGYRPVLASSVAVLDRGKAALPSLGLDRVATPLAAVRVAPGYFGVMEQTVAAPQTLTRAEIQSNPQLGEDIFRAVNRLPGLSGTDLSARFNVRGGSGSEIHVSLDGLELYEPFHLKDIDAALSIVDVESIGGIDLNTGGFSAQHGDHLTGVFAMRSVEPRTSGPHTAVGLSVTNLRAMSQGGFDGGRGGWIVSARRGYLDIALRLTNTSDSLKPTYYDVFGKVQYDLGANQRVSAHVLHANDRLTYLTTGEPNIESHYESSYGWLRWEGTFGERLRGEAVASIGRVQWGRMGTQDENGGSPLLRIDDRRRFDVGSLRQDWTMSFSDRAALRVGGEVKQLAADYYYLGWQRRFVSGNGEFGSFIDSTGVEATPEGSSLGTYASQRLRLASSLVVEGGVRYDRQAYGVRDAQVSPRISAAWTPFDGTAVRAAWGHYHQAQPIYELQAVDGIDTFFPAERAEHRVVGVEQQLPWHVSARAEVYERKLTHQRPRFINAMNAVQAFPEVTTDRIRIDPTEGNARGVEVYLRRAGATRFEWSASYALSRVQDKIDDRWTLRQMDQRHAFSLDASYRATSGKWRVSAGWLYHSGWPYTPEYFRVDTIFLDGHALNTNITSRIGALSSGRLPSYRRLDLRATRYFDTRRGRIAVFADIFNALNRRNALGWNYDIRFNPLRLDRSVDSQIPRLPTLGVTWEF